ncbi:MAG: CDP-alcohol phosphatidyltransferase family protein [Acidimicrobiales bacterium]|nr:CDP-alcohol phosphatidyltransferase family protein [Acidimicrobiales bacterium]
MTLAGGAPVVTSRSRYRDSVERLGAAQKSRVGPLYTVWINRWFGRRLAALADIVGMRPNQVTVVSAACTFVAIVLLCVVSGGAAVAAITTLLLVGFAFDAADGQLARLHGGGSVSGEWLDHMVDAIKVTALHGAVLIHLFRFTDVGDAWLLAPIGYATVNGGRFFAQILSDQLVRARTGRAKTAPVGQSMLKGIVGLPADYGVLCITFALLVVPGAFVAVYSAFLAANTLHFVTASHNRFREMQRIDGAAS